MNTIWILIAVGIGQTGTSTPIKEYWNLAACTRAADSFNTNVPKYPLTGSPRAIAFCMESGK